MLAYACIGDRHAGMFTAYTKQLKNKHQLEEIIQQKSKWPSALKDRDVLYFLAQSFRAKLMTELPSTKQQIKGESWPLSIEPKP